MRCHHLSYQPVQCKQQQQQIILHIKDGAAA